MKKQDIEYEEFCSNCASGFESDKNYNGCLVHNESRNLFRKRSPRSCRHVAVTYKLINITNLKTFGTSVNPNLSKETYFLDSSASDAKAAATLRFLRSSRFLRQNANVETILAKL